MGSNYAGDLAVGHTRNRTADGGSDAAGAATWTTGKFRFHSGIVIATKDINCTELIDSISSHMVNAAKFAIQASNWLFRHKVAANIEGNGENERKPLQCSG